ncbi:MAG: DUF2892 domain-containing protein [Candidatus Calescibacterium sp.]|nr:DUF2892 domain-containing protein [Candidatus Calescibacterium sp.]MCX7733259.1 DUF2892 domain-containing protein [bacterium]MDW8087672.1 DUF2892 domain-containing protein [Candidatus Calescibacterium sp.]
MIKNVGTPDRILRVLVGLAIIGWGIYAQNWLGAIGLIPLATGFISFCPLYKVLGISTCPLKREKN